ncbi:hypothetical protein [Zavarzinia sp.]|uniref:hypothetical protein n=1 Tax=Zavarzinia sp. TaxID=2027920 RepID=UPI003BB6868F|nr:hypothetical protein [Zavarzinia sp.]
MYRDVRMALFEALPGGSEASQIYLGLIVYILVLAALRRGFGHLAGIGIVILIGLALEVADVVFLRQSARGALPDLLHFTLTPLALFAAARARLLRL